MRKADNRSRYDRGVAQLGATLGIFALMLCCSCATPGGQSFDVVASQRIAFFLARICIPHIVRGDSIETLAKSQHLHRVTHCDIQECRHSYCSDNPALGCVDLEKDYCLVVIQNDDHLAALENDVVGIIKSDDGNWRPVLPLQSHTGYGSAYCERSNKADLTTFGVYPGHTTKLSAPYTHHAEFEVNVSRRGEPQWCESPCRNDQSASSTC